MNPLKKHKNFNRKAAIIWSIPVGILTVLTLFDPQNRDLYSSASEIALAIVFAVLLLWLAPLLILRLISYVISLKLYQRKLGPASDAMKMQYQNEAVYLCERIEFIGDTADKSIYQIHGENLNSILAPGMQLELPDQSTVPVYEVYAEGDMPDPYLPVGSKSAVCFLEEDNFDPRPIKERLSNEYIIPLKIINPTTAIPQTSPGQVNHTERSPLA